MIILRHATCVDVGAMGTPVASPGNENVNLPPSSPDPKQTEGQNASAPSKPPGVDHTLSAAANGSVSDIMRTAHGPAISASPVLRRDGTISNGGDPATLAEWMYGEARWADALTTENNGLRAIPALMTPSAKGYWHAEVSRLGAEDGRAIAALQDAGAIEEARMRLVSAFQQAPSSTYAAALTAALGGQAAVDELADLEAPRLLAAHLNLKAKDGTLTREDVRGAADRLLVLAEESPADVATMLESADPLIRRALLIEISTRYAENAIFTKYNEPTEEAMIFHFFEMLPEAARSRAAESFDGLLPKKSIEALKQGRSWPGRNFPNFTHAGQKATEYWADQANQGNVAGHLMGPFAAMATEETIVATLLTLLGARLGPALFSVAPRTMAVVGVGTTSFNLTLDAQQLATGQDPWTGRATTYPDQLAAALRAGSGLIILGSTAFAVSQGALRPLRPNEKIDMRDYVRVEADQDLGRWEVWVHRDSAMARGVATSPNALVASPGSLQLPAQLPAATTAAPTAGAAATLAPNPQDPSLPQGGLVPPTAPPSNSSIESRSPEVALTPFQALVQEVTGGAGIRDARDLVPHGAFRHTDVFSTPNRDIEVSLLPDARNANVASVSLRGEGLGDQPVSFAVQRPSPNQPFTGAIQLPDGRQVRVEIAPGHDQARLQVGRDARALHSSFNVRSHVEHSDEWRYVSQSLREVGAMMKEKYGIDRLYVGAGSARAILDTIYFGAPLKMRDLDVFAVADRPVDRAFAVQVGQSLDSPAVGELSTGDIRPRPRGNPNLPPEEQRKYNAGFGLFWQEGPNIFDLSIYHGPEDLRLNGIFDMDTVLIPISSDESLADVVERLTNRSYAQAVEDGIVVDTSNGYVGWVQASPKIANWTEVERDPLVQVLRVIRNYGKSGTAEMDPATQKRLYDLSNNQDHPTNSLQIVRALKKVLGDKVAAEELKMASTTALFDRWSKPLGELISRLDTHELKALIGTGMPNERLANLVGAIPAEQRFGLLEAFRTAKVAVPAKLTADWVREAFTAVASKQGWPANGVDLMAVADSTKVPVPFLRELDRIASSTSLSNNERRDLYIRAVLRRSDDPRQTVDQLLPDLPTAERQRLLTLADTVRVGRFSGVMDPFVHTDRNAVLDGIHNDVLDEVWVVPTTDGSSNKTLAPWQNRADIAEASLDFIPEARIPSVEQQRHSVLESGQSGGHELYEGRSVKWIEVRGGQPSEPPDQGLSRSAQFYIDSHNLYTGE